MVKLSHWLPSVGPGADPNVQASKFLSHSPSGMLPLLTARHVVTFTAKERHSPLTGTKLYCLVKEPHRCEQLAQGCYADGHGETRTHDLNDHKSILVTNPTTELVTPFHDHDQNSLHWRYGQAELI